MAPKENRRRAADADDIIQERLRSGAPPNDPAVEADMRTAASLGRMVDMRIPLVWLLGLLGAFAGLQIVMWFTVQRLNDSMVEVQATLKAGNAQNIQTILEIDRLKGRVERAEETYRDLQAQVMRQQLQPGRGGP